MTNQKATIYNAQGTLEKTPTPATVSVKLGSTEHIVVTPNEYKRLLADVDNMRRTIEQLRNEVSALKNRVSTVENKSQRTTTQMQSPWSGTNI